MPSGPWPERLLGEVAEVLGGGTPSTKEPAFWGGSIPWITPGEITRQEGRVVTSTDRTITEAGLSASAATLLPVNAVLLTSRATVGATALAGVPMATNQGFASLVASDAVLPRFLMYWAQANRAEFESRAGGSTFPEISRAKVKAIPICVPPLPEQRRIVDLIGALDAQIDKLDREAFLADELLSALRTREFSTVDATQDLASVASEIRSGGTPSRKNKAFYEGDIPWLKSGEVCNPWIKDAEEKITPEAIIGSSAWLVPAGSVVVAMYGATAAQVGYLAAPMATNQAVLALVPDPEKCDGRFLYHWFRYHSASLKEAASGAAQPNLSKAVIQREMSFPALDPAIQSKIGWVLDAAEAVAGALADEAETLRDCRTRLLSSLLGADIEIPESYDALLAEAV